MKILPSLLYPDFNDLAARFAESLPVSNEVHVDFADGVFVPNLLPDVERVSSLEGDVALEAHLMVQEPHGWVTQALDDTRFERIIVHAEAQGDIAVMLQQIQGLGRKAGVALKPETPVAVIEPWAQWLDQVLILCVDPGFNGSPFQVEAVAKIAEVVERFPGIEVSADGGMNPKTLPMVAKAGATRAAVGSYLQDKPLGEGLAALQKVNMKEMGWDKVEE